jgi:Mg-chelatase subunit ChlI
VRSRIAHAITNLDEVEVPRPIRRLIAHLSIALEVDGHRSDLVCARAAQAKAAYDGARRVETQHVLEVAEMVYAHRRRSDPLQAETRGMSEVLTRVIAAEARREQGLQPTTSTSGCCD